MTVQSNEEVEMDFSQLMAELKPPISIEESLLFLWRLKNKINGMNADDEGCFA